MSKIAGMSKSYGLSKLVFGLETTSGTETVSTSAKTTSTKAKSALLRDSVNNVYNISTGTLNPATLTYLATNKQLQGTFVNTSTITFNGIWLSSPAGLPATNVDNFSFFANGNFIEKSAIVSFVTDGISTSTLVVNPSLLGYGFDSGDLVLGIGKFA
jgi:hypothetical protein